MMDIKLACTHHNLFGETVLDSRFECEACRQSTRVIFACLRCKIRICRLCLKKLQHHQLPQEINDPLHPQQRLQLALSTIEFICDRCSYISSGYRYRRNFSNFYLDLTCAVSLEDRLYGKEEFKKKKTIHHAHVHGLTIFKYREVNERDYSCIECGKYLFDSQQCYGCLSCKLFLHESCSEKILRTIYHPFHPSHPLRLHFNPKSNYCDACGLYISDEHSRYWCNKCDFRLDLHCAKLSPTLKHSRHNHLLTCFANSYQLLGMSHQLIGPSRDRFHCDSCKQGCRDLNFCRCVQCNLTFHNECLPIPSFAKHIYHMHPLIFTNSIEEDKSEEYYCDICEEERNQREPVYYCKECNYIAHVHCVLNKDKISPEEIKFSTPQAIDDKALIVNEPQHYKANDNIDQLEDPFLHKHPMKSCYVENKGFYGKRYCWACRLELIGFSFICTRCPIFAGKLGKQCDFCLHEKCTRLPNNTQHPFHSIHPLHLYTTYRPKIGIMRCDECGDISLGFIYLCERCNFKLDVKCAALTASETHGVLQQKEMKRATELHTHELLLGNSNDPITPLECSVCELPTSGPIYFCPSYECFCHYVHESCVQLPRKLQLPFHDPEHTLVFRDYYSPFEKVSCSACPLPLSFKFGVLRYRCEQCDDFKLHTICAIECANSWRRPLKCDSHVHSLYYFGSNYQLLCETYVKKKLVEHRRIACAKCSGICSDPFYRCLPCKINFHLKCIPLPYILKSSYHIHPLTLKDSLIEDDSGEYYCDVCEEKRRPNDHVYCCEKCNGLFVTHIECAVAKVRREVSYEPNSSGEKESPILLNVHDKEEGSTAIEEEEKEDLTSGQEEEE